MTGVSRLSRWYLISRAPFRGARFRLADLSTPRDRGVFQVWEAAE